MRKKKDLPLVILKSLEPFVNLRGDKFEVIEPKQNLLHVIDKEIDSSFHFIIEKYQKQGNGNFQFLMKRSPKSHNENGEYQTWVEIAHLSKQFESWIKLLDEYDTVNSFFDDPIIKSFEEEFFAEFELIEDEADIYPLNTNQILMLDSHLENIENKLSDFTTPKNASNIEDIKSEITELRENLTTKSKKWVVKKLTTVWAKIAKQGTKFIKSFLAESNKQIIVQGVKGLIEFVKENGTDLIN